MLCEHLRHFLKCGRPDPELRSTLEGSDCKFISSGAQSRVYPNSSATKHLLLQGENSNSPLFSTLSGTAQQVPEWAESVQDLKMLHCEAATYS